MYSGVRILLSNVIILYVWEPALTLCYSRFFYFYRFQILAILITMVYGE